MSTSALNDRVSAINSKLDFLEGLKRMGEEPWEIEYDVQQVGDLIAEEFVSWLGRNKEQFPAEFARLVAAGLTQYVFLGPVRRTCSPLSCGKALQDKFLKQALKELELPKDAGFILKEGLRLFVKFRSSLKPVVH